MTNSQQMTHNFIRDKAMEEYNRHIIGMQFAEFEAKILDEAVGEFKKTQLDNWEDWDQEEHGGA